MTTGRRAGTGWRSWRLLRDTIGRLHRGYEAVPRAARRRWWRAMAVGAALLQLLALGLVLATRRLESAGALGWEAGVVRWFARSAPFSFNTAMWLEGIANGFVLWAVMLLGGAVAARRGRPFLALSFLVGYSAAYLPILTGWLAWERERPHLIAGGIADPGGIFHSFPSGHMVQATFAYGLLLWLWRRASGSATERAAIVLLFLLLALVVGAGRVRVGAHWPTDVAAGFVLGVAWLAVVVRAHAGQRIADGRHPNGNLPAAASYLPGEPTETERGAG